MAVNVKDYAILEILQEATCNEMGEQSLFLRSRLSRKQYERERTELIMAHILEPYTMPNGENGLKIAPPPEPPEKASRYPKPTSKAKTADDDDDKAVTRNNKKTYGYYNSVEAWADRLADCYGDVSFDEGESGDIWEVEAIENGKTYRYKVTVDDDGGIMVEKAGRW